MDQPTSALSAFVDRWYEAFPTGDAAAIADLYAADARLYLADLPGIQGRDAIGRFVASIAQNLDLSCRYSVTDIDLLSDDIAVITGAAWAESRPKAGGERSHDASRFVMVMVRNAAAGAWHCRYDVSQHTPDVAREAAPPSSQIPASREG